MSDKAQNTKERLLDAAAGVFVERGYARATTKGIAAAAGVAEGTIYRHFADKSELFQAVFTRQRAASADALVKLPELAGTATVRENLQRLIRLIEDAEEHVAPLAASVSSDAELTSALAALGADIEAGTAQDDGTLKQREQAWAELVLGDRECFSAERVAVALTLAEPAAG